MKKALALITGLMLICGGALADSISFSGTVQASDTWPVYIPTGVTVEEVPVKEGQRVSADTVIARIKTTKVYAEEDGVIAAVFGEVGDRASTVADRYGAVMYLEGAYTLCINTTISKAYDDPNNDIVHPGEKVYLISRAYNSMKGKGMITKVDGSSYTVLVTEGSFLVGDSIRIDRSPDYALDSSIGRGNIERISPVAITGSGYIVSYAVEAGQEVKKGQLLFETVDASFDNAEAVSTEIVAGTEGIISSLNVTKGATVAASGSTSAASTAAATIYPKDAVWVVADVSETDLKEISPGQKVKVELDWNQDQGVLYDGTVEMISYFGTAGEESTTYPVYVSFVPDENTRYNMTALVTTVEENEEESPGAAGADEEEAPAAAEQDEADDGLRDSEAAGEKSPSEREGRPSRPRDGESSQKDDKAGESGE